MTTVNAKVSPNDNAPLTAFGERLVAQITPEVQVTFPYSINTELVASRANQSATITQSGTDAVLQTGAGTNSSAMLHSKQHLKYNTGQGGLCRFTAIFTAGQAGSTQEIGIGTVSDGFFFGYNGASFGVLRRRGGVPEVRTLTVTTKSTTAEDITITLDGVAKTDVTVTDATAGDVTTTANDIAAADYSDVGPGWRAQAVGATVVFLAWDASSRTGTYSLSGASTAVGTFAQTLVGVSPTETWVAQADWNADPMLGTSAGNSSMTLDPTKGNVYQIRYQWLGYGSIDFYVEDTNTGRFVLVHRIQYANTATQTSLVNPILPVHARVANTTNTTNITLKTPSWMAGTEGEVRTTGDSHAVTAHLALGATAAETPVISVHNKLVYQSKENRIPVKVAYIACATEHSKPVTINIYRNSVLTAASWSDVDTNASPLEVDTSATGFSNGDLILSIPLGKVDSTIFDIPRHDIGVMEPGDFITATMAPSSNTNAEASVSLNIIERH